jgi:hypothetical protein
MREPGHPADTIVFDRLLMRSVLHNRALGGERFSVFVDEAGMHIAGPKTLAFEAGN